MQRAGKRTCAQLTLCEQQMHVPTACANGAAHAHMLSHCLRETIPFPHPAAITAGGPQSQKDWGPLL